MAKSKVKMKFAAGKAKSAKRIKENKSKGGGFGNMLWIKADTSKKVVILAEPKDWIEYHFVGLEKNASGDDMQYRKLPCYDGFDKDFDGADSLRVRTAYAIPVVEVDEDGKRGDRVMFYEPGSKVLDELLTTYERRGNLTDRDLDIIREGAGKNSTSYTLYWDDPDPKAKLREKFITKMVDKIPDIDEDLMRMVKEADAEFNKSDEDDEDEAPKKGKKSNKSKASKKRAMRDEEEDEDDEEEADDEEEDEEDDDADGDDDSEDESDEDDDEGDDDEDGEDDDEEEAELPSEADVKAMEFKELKAFAIENEVEVKAGSKSKGYRDAILEWLEEQGEDDEEADDEDDDEGEEEEGEERVESTFVMSNIDETAFTMDLEDADGNEYETVYLDRERDRELVGKLKEGAKYKFVIETDDQDDWVAVTPPDPIKKAKPAKKSTAKAKGSKKGKGKSKK